MGLVDRPRVEPQKQGGVPDWIGFYGIGATICIGRESLCLPYSGFCFYCQKHWPEYNDEDYIEGYDNYNGNESGEDDQSNKMPMGASKTL